MVGKPTADTPRNVTVRVRTTAGESSRWSRAAAKEGLTVSEWIRRLLNEAAGIAPKKKTREP